MIAIPTRSRWLALGLGLCSGLALLALSPRPGQAMKEDLCLNGTDSPCKTVERCEPSGFESDGRCKWIYSVSRYYWRN